MKDFQIIYMKSVVTQIKIRKSDERKNREVNYKTKLS